LPGWDEEDSRLSQSFGDAWFGSQRSPVLRVPIVVTHGPAFNLVLNALHPLFHRIGADDPIPVFWDRRLAPKGRRGIRTAAK